MTGVSAGTGIELSVEGHTKQECPAQVEGVETHSLMGLARYSLGLLGKSQWYSMIGRPTIRDSLGREVGYGQV
jgi:hypothetical protein